MQPTLACAIACVHLQVTVSVAGKGGATGSASVDVLSLSVAGFASPPSVLAPAGSYTLLTVNGVGFDPVNCTRNGVRLGSSLLLVTGCTATNLTVLLPGGLTYGRTMHQEITKHLIELVLIAPASVPAAWLCTDSCVGVSNVHFTLDV
jgi:hypothetical protein